MSLVQCATTHAQCRNRPASPTLPPGLRLTIRAETPVAETKHAVILQVELSNDSKLPVRMRDNWAPELNYELHARDSSGNEPPLTKFGRQLREGPVHGSGEDITLGPGEKISGRQDLSAIYEISVPGDYTVQACREIYTWGNIYSNKLTVPFIPPVPAR